MSRPVRDWADLKFEPDSIQAHIVPFGRQRTLCDRWTDDWFGTGEWREIEFARRLPRCPDCTGRLPGRTATA